MLLKKSFIFVFLAIYSIGYSQDYAVNKKFAPDQLHEDFSIMVSSLREHHPSLYNFFPKTQFDSLVTANLNALTDSLTEAEFHVVVRKFTCSIGCGHTAALPSKDWYQAIRTDQRLIPVHVELSDNQLYMRKVFSEYSDSIIDSRIIEIDGVPVSEVISEIKSIIERDGFTRTMVDRNLESLFQTFYLFVYGMKDTYQFVLELPSGALVEAKLDGMAGKRHNNRKPLEIDTLAQMEAATFGLLKSANHKAVIDMSSFQRKGFKKFYRQAFKQLAEMDSTDLILDLRGNGGGYFPNGNELLRYLLDDKFTMDFSNQGKRVKRNKHVNMNFVSKVTRFIFSTIPDRNKEDSARNYQIRYKPVKRNHFDGKIYVFVDGYTFSSGSFVASKLKNQRNAIIVGEETGGGEVGFNAVLTWNLDLPNSHLRVLIPAYHVDIQPEMIDIGRGVIPTMSLEEVLNW